MVPNIAWLVSMAFVICAICTQLMCWDMPTACNHDPAVTGNTKAFDVVLCRCCGRFALWS